MNFWSAHSTSDHDDNISTISSYEYHLKMYIQRVCSDHFSLSDGVYVRNLSGAANKVGLLKY